MHSYRFFKYWVPVIVWATLIFASSSMPKPLPVEVEIKFFDKGLHLVTYLILGWLLLRALFDYQYNLSRGQLLFIAILLGTLYGISDEFHQYFIPGRTACVSDAVFDFLGSVLGAFAYNHGRH